MHPEGTIRRHLRRWPLDGWTLGAVVIALLAAVPIMSVLWSLTASSEYRSADMWLTVLPGYLVNTLVLLLLVGAMSSVIGIGTAWLVTAADFPGRRLVSWLLVLPLAAPAYIVAYLYTDLLEYSAPFQTWLRFETGWEFRFPPIRNLPGAAVMLGLVLYPYVYLLARAAFAAQSHGQFLAARSLGLSPVGAFFRIVLPGARPAIIGGVSLVLMETLADFAVAGHFSVPTMSTGIYRTWLGEGERVAALQLAAVMLLFVVLLLGMEAAGRRGSVASEDRMSAQPPLFRLKGASAWLALTLCALPVLLGFIVPVVMLIVLAVLGGDGKGLAVLAGYASNSVAIAVIAAAIATLIALFLVYAQRQRSRSRVQARARSGLIRFASMGYALPGTLLAVGLFAPLSVVDQALTRWWRNTFDLDQGLILTGSIALLIYALVVRFLTVSYNSLSGGMAKIPPAMDSAARSLNASPLTVIRRIHMPLLAPSLAAGAALVFIDVMRELPATLMLRPDNMETLATRVYRLASDERIAEASTSALIIVLLGLLPVYLLNRVRN